VVSKRPNIPTRYCTARTELGPDGQEDRQGPTCTPPPLALHGPHLAGRHTGAEGKLYYNCSNPNT
jgi:hypothetical protein